MTGPADTTANYLALMQQRGWTWDDLADQFDREALDGRALDRGANARRMATWARSNATAGRERQAAADDPLRPDPGAPEHATPNPGKRTALPRPAPAKRGATPVRSRRRPDPAAAAAPIAVVDSPTVDVIDGGAPNPTGGE